MKSLPGICLSHVAILTVNPLSLKKTHAKKRGAKNSNRRKNEIIKSTSQQYESVLLQELKGLTTLILTHILACIVYREVKVKYQYITVMK